MVKTTLFDMGEINILVIAPKKYCSIVVDFFKDKFPKTAKFYFKKDISKIADKLNFLIYCNNKTQFSIDDLNVFFLHPLNPSSSFDKEINVQNSSNCFILKTINKIESISKESIAYVEVMGHKIIFYLKDGQIKKTSGSLKQIENKLSDSSFVRCNYCYLINLKHVQKIEGYMVYINGKCLPISQSRRRNFMQQFITYNSNN